MHFLCQKAIATASYSNVVIIQQSYTYVQAVGEPPLFLGASVAFAIRDAIAYVRRQAGVSECFTLDSPVTCERIRMACPDHITKQVSK